jgi:hypothetical protein
MPSTNRKPRKTIDVASLLRAKFEKSLSKKFEDSSLYVDLADIYEVSAWYMSCIEKVIAKPGVCKKDDLVSLLVELQIQLLEHLPYHQKTLKRHIARALSEL